MSFYEAYFDNVSFGKKETAVCCPFPHQTEQGIEYQEIHPSAHVNLSQGVYHCKVCGSGMSEVGFIAKVLGTTYEDAVKLQKLFQTKEDVFDWTTNTEITPEIREQVNSLGISDRIIEQLNITTIEGNEISIPVFIHGRLLDVRSYRPFGPKENKIKSRVGTTSGLIIPYDIWRESPLDRVTLICAGEKDMMLARTRGFQAITITGGEMALPKMVNAFKDRRVAICYDNDDAGLKGAKNLAVHLHKVCAEVKVITGFHKICDQQGEDLTDFFNKYRRSAADLVDIIKDTPVFSHDDAIEALQSRYPSITLLQASQPKYVNRVVQSNVQVVATYDKALTVPTTIIGRKVNITSDKPINNKMLVGEERTWTLTESNVQDILHFMDNNFTETKIKENIKTVLHIPLTEWNVTVNKPTKETIYKCNVIDLFDAASEHTESLEFEAYVLKKKMEAGKKYRITYKIVPHPYKGQQLTMIILDVEESSDSVTNFKLTDETKRQLNIIRELPGTLEEKVESLTDRVKAFTKYDGYNQLIQAIDFSYNTVLEFHFGSYKNVRGYLDTIVVAESRVGKSTTALALQKLYGLGMFTSLAGSSATVAGLVGGSNKVNGTFQTRAGVIPQNHKGLIIFEELGKSNANIIKELTDIRSSNQVRLARVSGTVELPAMVRMITLTNPKMVNGSIRSIQSYPNGIEVLTDLIGTAEDIARFDLMLILGDTGNKRIDPFWMPPTPFHEDIYRTRVRWIWSRTPEQVIITPEIGRYILEQANEVNVTYNSYIKVFGTEAWKKIARLAIAVAGYTVSTDDSYEHIIVEKEHVDFAINYLVKLYDNPTFKFKQFVDMERRFTEVDEHAIEDLQAMYIQAPSIVLHLEQTSRSSKSNLQMATGLDAETFGVVMSKLVRGAFIKLEGYDIIPTERFRKAMAQVIRESNITRVGEYNV